MKTVAVMLAEGFEEVEAVTPIDFLRRAGIEVITAGITGERVTGSHGIAFLTDATIREILGKADTLDGVIVPGGMPGAANVAESAEARKLIMKMMQEGKLVAAICAAPAVVLEPLGVLRGKAATCYPGFEEKFSEAVFKPDRVVKDANVITSRGPGSAAEFSIAIIEYLTDKATAESIRQGTLQK